MVGYALNSIDRMRPLNQLIVKVFTNPSMADYAIMLLVLFLIFSHMHMHMHMHMHTHMHMHNWLHMGAEFNFIVFLFFTCRFQAYSSTFQ